MSFEYNMDIKKRDEIIFGKYEPEKYIGGTRRFEKMSLQTLKKLIELEFADGNESQNYSPTIYEFIDFMENNSGYMVNGYVVSDTRNDYRVSIEAIEKREKIDNYDDLVAFIEFARHADDFDVSGYAWWD